VSPENASPPAAKPCKGGRNGPAVTVSIAPLGLQWFIHGLPRAHARGYCLTPLSGLTAPSANFELLVAEPTRDARSILTAPSANFELPHPS
jgi:hypothetical protein